MIQTTTAPGTTHPAQRHKPKHKGIAAIHPPDVATRCFPPALPKHSAGRPIPGLYAAGRSAVGIPSNNYVSGLSLADGVWSGRRAAGAIADSAASISEAPRIAAIR